MLPAFVVGAAVTSMALALPRREVNIRRVERAMMVFWASMAILMSAHYGLAAS